jgi:glucose/arabinose dehydrogenase
MPGTPKLRATSVLVFGLMLCAPALCGCGVVNVLLPTSSVPQDGTDRTFELAGERFRIETVVTGLEVPWSIDFSRDGGLLVATERPGRLSVFDPNTGFRLATTAIADVAPQIPFAEFGLMGLALSPDFDQDQTIYISYTVLEGLKFRNVIDRLTLIDGRFNRADEEPLFDDLPAAFIHDGLPIKFGPDGMFYISIGDASVPDRAQDASFLGGKFLRVTRAGSIPQDNPFDGSPVWSIGHRNPQGFDFHPEMPDVLISTEHGSSGEDEINLIKSGRNYGWPDFRRDQTAPGIEPPIWHSGDESVAPSGATFCSGKMFPDWKNAFLFVGLRGASLWVVRLSAENLGQIGSIERGLQGVFGRLRGIRESPDGSIYITTSNRDSRGTPGPNDDRILRLVRVE